MVVVASRREMSCVFGGAVLVRWSRWKVTARVWDAAGGWEMVCVGANVSKPSETWLAARRQIMPSPRRGWVPMSRAQTHSPFFGCRSEDDVVSWGWVVAELGDCPLVGCKRAGRGAGTDIAP